MSKIPFTILTGFLGAGKTTTLNRVLGAPHGRRIAVLVNELGRIAVDTKLILFRGSDVLELAGGCVCCKLDVKSDLWDGIAEVVKRTSPDQVVLETTGIAEPAAILDGLDRVPASVRDRIVPAGVVCVVDAEAGAAQLDRHDEAREQIAAADRVLLRKLDRAAAAQVAAVRGRIAELGPDAELASFPADEAGDMAMTSWLLEARGKRKSGHGHGHGHGHGKHSHKHGQLSAVVFVEDAPLLGDAVLGVLERLGSSLVRAKGFVRVAGSRNAAFAEKAGAVLELRTDLPWPGEPRTELVLIGADLDEAAIRRALWACRAAA
ncbi:MAG TPA: GTP-binding protein [Kofleriaceae bacterium]|nr:GTP-binding protein [Kofleriaceae bacterium]